MQPPTRPLPYGSKFRSADDYISSLLAFVTSSSLHQSLCGGVHILDFMTRDPDLYTTLIPSLWRSWFADVSIEDLLDLMFREDLTELKKQTSWRRHAIPPICLIQFISQIRDLCLDRSYHPCPVNPPARLDRRLAVGMNIKKEHEVSQFAGFVASLSDSSSLSGEGRVQHKISHILDIGSGQNYLGRVLAGPNYKKSVIALESRPDNIDGARKMDVSAKLTKKIVVWRNKKMWKEEGKDNAEEQRLARLSAKEEAEDETSEEKSDQPIMQKNSAKLNDNSEKELPQRITYLEHVIQDGDLNDIAEKVETQMNNGQDIDSSRISPKFLVISLHSCGNLVHHGLRSLILNSSVKAVAMIGCCYNLCTERLGPPTYKLPNLGLRSANPRLVKTSLTSDPHGFPMSKRFLEYSHGKFIGVRFNITARMMAVQAAAKWTIDECEDFFTRHFYRALLQRIFLDIGFVPPPLPADDVIGGSARGWTGGTEPIIIGSLTKACYKNFVDYVRGAVKKIAQGNPEQGRTLEKCLQGLSDEDIAEYEKRYAEKRHELCVVWSLMAFAAQLVECAIVVDRWSFLVEQNEVATAWVQTVFEYNHSPRNLVIVGIKK